MIHLKKALDTRRAKKNGTYPIVFRISLNGLSRGLSTGQSCQLQDWDTQRHAVKPKTAQLEVIIQRLLDQEIILLKKIRDYEAEYPNTNSIQDAKDYLQNKRDKPFTVREFWDREIIRLNTAKNFGNARNYKSALDGIVLKSSLSISFVRIDYKWLIELETKLQEDGLKANSISTYMRKIRSIYNKAINYGLVDANNYPFRRYRIKNEATVPRIASITELQEFFSYSTSDHKKKVAWNYARLIFILRGINFIDLALLTRDNIKHDRIIYKRSKTHRMYSIKLHPLAKAILYINMDDDRETLLPILTNEELKNNATRHDRIRQQRKTCNKWLRKIGVELKIKESLSTYVFRYGFANACKQLGYPKDMIGEALGHSTGSKITSSYLDDYDIEIIDAMCRAIIDKIRGV